MAPALKSFIKYRASTGAWRPGQDMSWSGGAVNLHNMKAIPSTGERIPAIGLGTASSFSRAARTPDECYAR